MYSNSKFNKSVMLQYTETFDRYTGIVYRCHIVLVLFVNKSGVYWSSAGVHRMHRINTSSALPNLNQQLVT